MRDEINVRVGVLRHYLFDIAYVCADILAVVMVIGVKVAAEGIKEDEKSSANEKMSLAVIARDREPILVGILLVVARDDENGNIVGKLGYEVFDKVFGGALVVFDHRAAVYPVVKRNVAVDDEQIDGIFGMLLFDGVHPMLYTDVVACAVPFLQIGIVNIGGNDNTEVIGRLFGCVGCFCGAFGRFCCAFRVAAGGEEYDQGKDQYERGQYGAEYSGVFHKALLYAFGIIQYNIFFCHKQEITEKIL